MPGRLRPTLLASAALAAMLSSSIVAGCGAAPTALSDPRAILDAAVGHLRAARSVHLDASVDGTLALAGLVGGPQASGPGLGLTGTHLAADLDLAAVAADLHFQVPALLGLEGELRQLGGETFLESSLTSRGWHRLTSSDLPAPLDRPADWIGSLTDWLSSPGTAPLRLDDASCASGGCYVVRLAVTGDALRALASGVPGAGSAVPGLPSSLGAATVSVDLRIDRASLVLSEAVAHVDLGSGGGLSVSVTFSAWDAPVSVARPAASEIVTGPLFP